MGAPGQKQSSPGRRKGKISKHDISISLTSIKLKFLGNVPYRILKVLTEPIFELGHFEKVIRETKFLNFEGGTTLTKVGIKSEKNNLKEIGSVKTFKIP